MRAGVSLFLALILTVALLPTASSSGVNYYTANSNDYGAYLYFTSLLSNFSNLYGMILSGDVTELNASYGLFSLVNSTYETAVLYSGVVDGKILSLAAYFKTLGGCSFEIASGNSEFRTAMRESNYVLARDALLRMEAGLSSCRGALLGISSVELLGENGESLRLDVTNASLRLDEITSLIEDYRRALNAAERPSNFSVFVSDGSPMALENVTIFGYAPNMSSVVVVINGTNYTPVTRNGTFSMIYSFLEPGTYGIYAIGVNSSGSFRSNVIRVNVTRIATRIIAEEERGENVTVSGYLIDYWGRGIPNARLSLLVGDNVYPAVTGDNGLFNVTLNVPSEVNATVLFGGNSLYAPSNTTLLIVPARLKPRIRLIYTGGAVKAGDFVTIKGKVSPEVSIPLVVYVDDSPYTTITARGKFSFRVRFSAGTHEVYAYFAGNGEFSPSKSNVIQITATPVSYVERFLLFLAFFVLAGVGYWFLNRRKPVPAGAPEGESLTQEGGEGGPSDVLGAYRLVYRFLRRLYSLPPSVTPRELLSMFGGRPFYRDLKELTSMHERSLYARARFGVSEVVGALKRASRVIITAVVGDEL